MVDRANTEPRVLSPASAVHYVDIRNAEIALFFVRVLSLDLVVLGVTAAGGDLLVLFERLDVAGRKKR